MSNTYSQGHHSSVVSCHAIRTSEVDAAFLLPLLQKSDHILDVGCGPGSITLGFAKRVPEGRVVGVDISGEIVQTAQKTAASKGIANITFLQADILPFPDSSFEVVFFHQTLCHLSNPGVFVVVNLNRCYLKMLGIQDESQPPRLGTKIASSENIHDSGAAQFGQKRAIISDGCDIFSSPAILFRSLRNTPLQTPCQAAQTFPSSA